MIFVAAKNRMDSSVSEGLRTTLNPWDGRGSALGINLGDPARVLTLGRKRGLVSQDGREEMEEHAKEKASEYGSVEMIKQLQELGQLSSDLHKLDLQEHQLLLDRETADFTHPDRLEERLGHVKELVSHLSTAMERKEAILGQLQATTAAENSLTVEAPYQMAAHRVLTSLGSSVSSVRGDVELLERANRLQLDKTQLGKKLSHGEETLAQCQGVYNTAHRLFQAQSTSRHLKKC